MPLHDTDAYIIEGLTAAESLPDPTLVAGRSHRLHNAFAGTQVFSSVGATPFLVGGVNSANLTIPQGQAVEVFSSGTRWVAAAGPTRQFDAGVVVSGAGGICTIVFGSPFPVVPDLVAQVQAAGGSNAPFDIRITALSAVGATLEIRSAAAVNVALLGLTILLGTTVSVGTTVHWIATVPGKTP